MLGQIWKSPILQGKTPDVQRRIANCIRDADSEVRKSSFVDDGFNKYAANQHSLGGVENRLRVQLKAVAKSVDKMNELGIEAEEMKSGLKHLTDQISSGRFRETSV